MFFRRITRLGWRTPWSYSKVNESSTNQTNALDKGSAKLQMHDETLTKMVKYHSNLSNVGKIAENILNNSKQAGILTDSQTIFVCFAFNLYFNEFASSDLVISEVLRNLRRRIEQQNYEFQSQDIEQQYLQQLYLLTGRDQIGQESKRELIHIYLQFITQKYGLEAIFGSPVKSDEVLDRLWIVMQYIPKEGGRKQEFYGKLLETFQLVVRHQSCVFTTEKNGFRMGGVLDRFSRVGELGIRIANCRNQKIDFFSHFPSFFKQQSHFNNFLLFIRQYVNEEMMAKSQLPKMKKFHQNLSKNNSHFRSQKSLKLFQDYCEHLIFMEVFSPFDFNTYLSHGCQSKSSF